MTVTAPRREQLLDAAAGLFASRGYHAVGIDDIGAAAGITGPGVYRHFAGKQALLEHLCDRAMTRMLEGAQGLSRDGTLERTRNGTLDALVDLHVEFAVGQHALLGVWVREQRALSDNVRHSLRQRQRAYEQVWRDALQGERPEVTRQEAQLIVWGALSLLNASALVQSDLPVDRLHQLLRTMALGALLTPAVAIS